MFVCDDLCDILHEGKPIVNGDGIKTAEDDKIMCKSECLYQFKARQTTSSTEIAC